MKKLKMFTGGFLLVSAFSLISCDLLTDNSDTNVSDSSSSKTSDSGTTKTGDNATATKKEVKYEVGTATVDSWTDSINNTWIKFAVPVKNTGNVNIYIGDMSVDIESSTGSLLKTKSMVNGYPNIIKPGETAYYYDETTVDFDTTGIKVVPHVDVQKTSNEVIRYDISDVSISEDEFYGIKVMGRVENKTSKSGSLVYLTVNLFDSSNNLICTCYTSLDDDLKPGDKIGFTIKPYAHRVITPSDVDKYEIYAYPYQFNLSF